MVSIPLSVLTVFVFSASLMGQIVSTIVLAPVTILVAPFSLIAFTLLYYDLRIRKENLDLEVMIDSYTQSSSDIT